MEEKYKKLIISKILEESGIVIAPIHSLAIISYVEKQLCKLNMSIDEYCVKLNSDKDLLNDLVNQATTNETYFFREAKQFDYLKDVVFPQYGNRRLVIWSAACSTGEEPLSLLALAMHFNINAQIYASDIDDTVLEFFKHGRYSKYSFRNDGQKYHEYLKCLGSPDRDGSHFIFNQDILQKIKIFKYNLTDFSNFPISEKIDIIFMRNVFIYFDINTRKLITKNVTSHLNDGGHLFYSINEIGSINSSIVPDFMVKKNYNQIYFFIKKSKSATKQQTWSQYNEQNKKNSSVCDGAAVPSHTDTIYIRPSDVYNNMNRAIMRKDYDGAFKIANEYKPAFSDSYYSSFFKGYVCMSKKDYSNAEKYFITSEFMKSNFWPVYYFHGVLLEEVSSKEKAAYCFKKCLEQMKIYIENPTKEFEFLLKDFTPSFIYSYCSRFIKG